MIEIFVDGIRSVGVANGVVRIEFAQLRRSTDGESRMIPEPVATVMVPVSSMRGLLKQLTDTMQQIQAQSKQAGGPGPEEALP